MKASTRFEVKQAFVLDERDLRKLWSILESFTPELQAKMTCSDGLSRVPIDINEAAGYENPKRASVLSFDVRGHADDRELSSEVVISSEHSNSISFSLRGDEQVISSLRIQLIDFFDGLRPWYSKVATFNLIFMWAPIFAVIFAVLKVMYPASDPALALTFKQAILTAGLVIVVGSLLILCISYSGGLKKLCFPVATFAIGQGAKRHAIGENVRWVVIIGFLVSVLASGAYALLPSFN